MENEILSSELKGNRTLATVAFTDCVGFSARMSVDEDHTLDLIRRDLKMMKRLCELSEGRVLKTTGDGLLMCFSSAVKAVECAIAIQQAISEAAASLTAKDTLTHRIGIHLADMYITPTDVMGNGVNIAARLQTEADPGGICISQTVYDVAKHGLQLKTKYLGPRELKNIREVVPAYKILLQPENEADAFCVEAARRLEQDANRARIKKLLFYVCKNRWESNPAVLDAANFKDLIQELLGLAQTFDHLRKRLETAVQALSKQTEYTAIANLVLREVANFYAIDSTPSNPLLLVEADDSTQVIAYRHPADNSELQPIYQQIAQALEQDPDVLRLRKLLYYICRRHWESDPNRLQSLPVATLLQELHSQASTAGQITSLIDRFVQTLNKRTEYALVASTLVGYLVKLYPELAIALPLNSEPPPTEGKPPSIYDQIATQLRQKSHALRVKKLMAYLCRSQWFSDPTQLVTIRTADLVEELFCLAPTSKQLQTMLDSVVSNLSKQAEYAEIANQIVIALQPLYLPSSTETPAPPSEGDRPIDRKTTEPPAPKLSEPSIAVNPPPQPAATATPTQPTISLFDIRLGILKYANPLRVKILLFSALNSDFTFSYQDWLSLKQYELDGLVQNILTACKTYTDLELRLYSTAKRLQDPEEQVQTADTVVKCLRAFYIYGNPFQSPSQTLDSTRVSLDAFEEATLGLAIVDDGSNHLPILSSAELPAEERDGEIDSGEHTRLLPATEPESAAGKTVNTQD